MSYIYIYIYDISSLRVNRMLFVVEVNCVFSGKYKVTYIRGTKSGNFKTQCSFGDLGY